MLASQQNVKSAIVRRRVAETIAFNQLYDIHLPFFGYNNTYFGHVHTFPLLQFYIIKSNEKYMEQKFKNKEIYFCNYASCTNLRNCFMYTVQI